MDLVRAGDQRSSNYLFTQKNKTKMNLYQKAACCFVSGEYKVRFFLYLYPYSKRATNNLLSPQPLAIEAALEELFRGS